MKKILLSMFITLTLLIFIVLLISSSLINSQTQEEKVYAKISKDCALEFVERQPDGMYAFCSGRREFCSQITRLKYKIIKSVSDDDIDIFSEKYAKEIIKTYNQIYRALRFGLQIKNEINLSEEGKILGGLMTGTISKATYVFSNIKGIVRVDKYHNIIFEPGTSCILDDKSFYAYSETKLKVSEDDIWAQGNFKFGEIELTFEGFSSLFCKGDSYACTETIEEKPEEPPKTRTKVKAKEKIEVITPNGAKITVEEGDIIYEIETYGESWIKSGSKGEKKIIEYGYEKTTEIDIIKGKVFYKVSKPIGPPKPSEIEVRTTNVKVGKNEYKAETPAGKNREEKEKELEELGKKFKEYDNKKYKKYLREYNNLRKEYKDSEEKLNEYERLSVKEARKLEELETKYDEIKKVFEEFKEDRLDWYEIYQIKLEINKLKKELGVKISSLTTDLLIYFI